jgi:hypothetical protein
MQGQLTASLMKQHWQATQTKLFISTDATKETVDEL